MHAIQIGDHILGIYHNSTMLDHAMKFLKDGFDNKEIVLLLTDNFSKEEFTKKIQESWDIDQSESLEGQNMFLKSTKEWCFPKGFFDTNWISNMWKTWIIHVKDLKLNGLRVFVDNSSTFEAGLAKDLCNYESTYASKFTIPLTMTCGYGYDDAVTLSEDAMNSLKKCHNKHYYEKEEINKRINDAVKSDTSHTKKFSS